MSNPKSDFNPAILASTLYRKRNEWNDVSALAQKEQILQDAFTANHIDLGIQIVTPGSPDFAPRVSDDGVIVIADAPIDKAASDVLAVWSNGQKHPVDVFNSNFRHLVAKESRPPLSIGENQRFTNRDDGRFVKGPPAVHFT